MSRNAHFYLKLFIISVVACSILGYAYYQSKNFITGAELEIYEPQNGGVSTTSLIHIKGRAQNISHIRLNDAQIFTDESGIFLEKILLSPGYNAFKIEVEDKFKRKTVKILEIIYKPEKEEVLFPTPTPSRLENLENSTTTVE